MKLNRIALGILVVMTTISSIYAYDIELCEDMRGDENDCFFAVYWKGKCYKDTNLDDMKKAPLSSDELIQASRQTDKISSSYSLIGEIRFPATIDRFILKLGQPEGVAIRQCDPSDRQEFQWHIGSARIRIDTNDYFDSKQPDYHARTNGGYLVSNGKPIRSLFGVVINKDNYVTVRNKISKHIKCRKNIAPIDLYKYDSLTPMIPTGCEDVGCSHVLRTYDPRHKLFAVFYFKNGILYQIWQGVFDITNVE